MLSETKYIQCKKCWKYYVAYSMKNGNKGGNREICRSCERKINLQKALTNEW